MIKKLPGNATINVSPSISPKQTPTAGSGPRQCHQALNFCQRLLALPRQGKNQCVCNGATVWQGWSCPFGRLESITNLEIRDCQRWVKYNSWWTPCFKSKQGLLLAFGLIRSWSYHGERHVATKSSLPPISPDWHGLLLLHGGRHTVVLVHRYYCLYLFMKYVYNNISVYTYKYISLRLQRYVLGPLMVYLKNVRSFYGTILFWSVVSYAKNPGKTSGFSPFFLGDLWASLIYRS